MCYTKYYYLSFCARMNSSFIRSGTENPLACTCIRHCDFITVNKNLILHAFYGYKNGINLHGLALQCLGVYFIYMN
jgi:hypothetical protein